MYDCQQLQLMYQVHQVKNDNDYTQIKSRIKEEKKWWYGTGVNMSKNCKTIDLRSAQVNHNQNGHTAFGQNGRTGKTTTKTATLHLVKTATQGGGITGLVYRHACQTAATRITTKTATFSMPCQASVTHAGVLARMQQGPFL